MSAITAAAAWRASEAVLVTCTLDSPRISRVNLISGGETERAFVFKMAAVDFDLMGDFWIGWRSRWLIDFAEEDEIG